MLPSPLRRAASLACIGLLSALLPLVVSTGPARASAVCQSERPGLLGITCDDETPPNTTAATGSQTGAGQVTVTAAGSYGSTGDTGAISFECRLSGTAAWGPCVISGLSAGGYDVSIRAIDTPDNLLVTPCDDLLCGSTPEVPDYDATPATAHVTVTGGGGSGGGGGGTGGGTTPPPPGPGGAPETQISGAPSDRITPSKPVFLTRRPTIQLSSSEPATFNCAINAKKVACRDGINVLKKLTPGTNVLVAQAVDRDGNFDATPASITFYVPFNFSTHQGKGWKKVKARGSYAGDYLTTKRQGALLTLGRVEVIRELRLIAPSGPQLGKVEVRIGDSKWFKVSLRSAKAHKLAVFEVRNDNAGPLSGAIQVRALKVPAGGAVAVDAIVAR